MRFRPAMDATTGELYLPVEERGRQLLEEPLLNKGSAFTSEEREALTLRGLLPAHTSTMDEHLARVRSQWDAKPNALERHIFIAGLHDRNETLFHRFILENLAGSGAHRLHADRGRGLPALEPHLPPGAAASTSRPATGARSPGCCAAAASATPRWWW